MPRVYLLLALLWLPLVVGCEGCRRETDPDSQQEQIPLADFSARSPQTFPADANPLTGLKPGHWVSAMQPLKSNKLDARGHLLARAWATTSDDQQRRLLTRQGDLPTMRPVVLPKGQWRRFDYRILTPTGPAGEGQKSVLDNRLVVAGRTVEMANTREEFAGFRLLAPEEFFFVILTGRPERFAKFQVSDWVRPYRDQSFSESARGNYRIVIPSTDDLIPLAETMLDWTSTAVLVWDDLSPDALTPQQQTAIADWVRFGGQLIVNGAAGSEAVAKSSLAELLPIRPSGNIELDPDAAAELLQSWDVASDRSTEKQIALLRDQSGRVALDGPLAPDAEVLPGSGSLLITKTTGRGRVVQSRFDLTSDWLINWQSYDSFVNAVLLARPRRELRESNELEDLGFIEQRYPDLGLSHADPGFNSRFRVSARDALLDLSGAGSRVTSAVPSRYDPLTAVNGVSGIAAWNDNSDVIGLSRQILRSESGIEIPDSSLVVRSLGIYLLILVPVNYLVFRLLGRLEYAWLAVPVIAIAGAIWVARAARLDIGFARSQTEIAFLELHARYPRGHLSRVVAIYNSLSSSYELEFKTADAAAAPVREAGRAVEDDGTLFKTGFSEGPILSGFPVISNQVRMIHAEQMVDLGGGIDLDEAGQLVNRSVLELSDAVVVEKNRSGDVQIAVVGPFAGGSAARLRFRPASEVTLPNDLPMQTSRLIRSLVASQSLPENSMRLVARYDGSIEGMAIRPAMQQASAQTIVVAHLKYPDWPEPKVDMNLIGDLRRVLTDEDSQGNRDSDRDEADKT